MAITTVSIACDVGLSNGSEFVASQLNFRLSGPDYDGASNDSIPDATVSLSLSASGVGTVSLWPVDRGVRNRHYDVNLIGSAVVNGKLLAAEFYLGRIRPPSGANAGLASLLAQSSGEIVVGSVVYESIADAVAAAQQAAQDAGASAASAVAITGTIIGAGNGQFQNGSAAAPSVTFASDTNTGLYRVAADVLGLSTNGVERVRVTNAGAQVTGLLTGTAVTQTTIDTTAGRLLKVRDFGIGTVGTSGPTLDLNSAVTTGIYNYLGTDPNSPFGAEGGSFIVTRHAGTFVTQIAFAGVSRFTATRTSSDNGATWTAWSRVYSQTSILGTVTQSGGQPTGAVIERGSNANGEFTRFADGTLICNVTNLTMNPPNVASGSLFVSNAASWTFPSPFVGAPNVYTGAVRSSQRRGAVETNNNTSAGLRVWSSVSSATALGMDVTAIGRWF